MPTLPLFVATLSLLKSNLRLSDVPMGDAEQIIETGISKARLFFKDRLGSARINAIVAMTATDPPTTDDHYTRLRANLCEIAVVRVYLLRTMPVLLRDERSGVQQEWNQEGLTRDMSQQILSREISRCEDEIEEMIEALIEGENDNETIRVATLGRQCANVAPGSSILGGRFGGKWA